MKVSDRDKNELYIGDIVNVFEGDERMTCYETGNTMEAEIIKKIDEHTLILNPINAGAPFLAKPVDCIRIFSEIANLLAIKDQESFLKMIDGFEENLSKEKIRNVKDPKKPRAAKSKPVQNVIAQVDDL